MPTLPHAHTNTSEVFNFKKLPTKLDRVKYASLSADARLDQKESLVTRRQPNYAIANAALVLVASGFGAVAGYSITDRSLLALSIWAVSVVAATTILYVAGSDPTRKLRAWETIFSDIDKTHPRQITMNDADESTVTISSSDEDHLHPGLR